MASNEEQTRITIERKEYALLVTAAKKYKTTVQSLQHFHITVEEKNKKIRQLEEKKVKLEVALAQSEHRVANLILIHGKEKINETDISVTTGEGTHSFGFQSQPETNPVKEAPPHHPHDVYHIKPSMGGALVTDNTPSQQFPVSLPPPYEAHEFSKPKSGENIDTIEGKSATPVTSTHETVSRVVFEKVTSENIRLRNQLDLEEQEKDIFRDASEYEDIIKQLKVDQVNLNDQVNRLQTILTTMKDGNHSALGTHLVELLNKVVRQDKVLAAKEALLEMYSKEIEKLKSEIDSLKLQLFKATGTTPKTEGGKGSTSAEARSSSSQTKEPKESYIRHLEKEIERVKEISSKEKNDLKTSLKKLVADKVLLQQKCEEYAASVDSLMKSRISKDMPTTLVELQKENIELTKKLHVYRHELEKTITEKDIADTQAQLFKEDFEEEKLEREKAEEQLKIAQDRLIQDIASQRGHISRLSNECAQLSKTGKEDKMQRQKVENEYHELKKKYDGLIMTLKKLGATKQNPEIPKSCATTVGPAIKLSQPSSLAVDSSMTEQPAEHPTKATAKPGYQCSRCLRDFDSEKLYKEHVERCFSSF